MVITVGKYYLCYLHGNSTLWVIARCARVPGTVHGYYCMIGAIGHEVYWSPIYLDSSEFIQVITKETYDFVKSVLLGAVYDKR